MMLSETRFLALWGALGATGDGRDVLERLRALYDEPHRAYHTARHIDACLRILDEPPVTALAVRPLEVEAALWFHDAIYDTHASDNEARSAAMAEECLGSAGVATDAVARIAGHIRATKDHATDAAASASASDACVVVDVDLSILGESAETFARFEQEIRREYSWVPPELYASGRAAVLRRFALRPSIYATPYFRARYEARARENIAAALAALASPR